MTKSRERGGNEISEAAKREAARIKRNICDILAAQLAAAKLGGDAELITKIIQAQK